MAAERITVEVAFALPHKQRVVALAVLPGTSAREAVLQANLAALFPELPEASFASAPLGIFGKALRDPEARVVEEGERIEVYRPLEIDPKAARLARARRQADDSMT
ncbi:RnfH family protein [Halomonas dongshanensis]|uniref:UPF0125 protein LLY24_02625 n=1 Tax=Halomonas dongshanensis TaxID=2890835 RepID=A0ABT2E9F6_9GAMM|nr:RnfH family protein [Halomonas dongshanensis]MCS2608215.1 RnfH family protein [Halomonas dongshanensis]